MNLKMHFPNSFGTFPMNCVILLVTNLAGERFHQDIAFTKVQVSRARMFLSFCWSIASPYVGTRILLYIKEETKTKISLFSFSQSYKFLKYYMRALPISSLYEFINDDQFFNLIILKCYNNISTTWKSLVKKPKNLSTLPYF